MTRVLYTARMSNVESIICVINNKDVNIKLISSNVLLLHLYLQVLQSCGRFKECSSQIKRRHLCVFFDFQIKL